MDPSPGTELTCPAGDRSGSSPDKNRALCMHICERCMRIAHAQCTGNQLYRFFFKVYTYFVCMHAISHMQSMRYA